MKQFKKYIYINIEDENDDQLTMKIVNSFTGDKVKEALDVQDSWTPLDKDNSLYFMPGCLVPRFKVRETFVVTIKPSKATALFVNFKELTGSDNTLKHMKNCYIPENQKEAKDFIKNLHQSHFINIIESLENSTQIEAIVFGYNLWYPNAYSKKFTKTGLDFNDYLTDFNKYTNKHNASKIENQLYGIDKNNDLGKIIDTVEFYEDSSVLPFLNNGHLVIDEAKYEELRTYAEAGKENVILLMELMANSDYKNSIVHLMFLLKEYGSVMLEYKEAHHVNFKAMLNFLGLTPASIATMSVMRLTKVLQEHKVFTKSNVARLSMLYAGEYINYSDPENTMWTEGLSLNPEEFKNLD